MIDPNLSEVSRRFTNRQADRSPENTIKYLVTSGKGDFVIELPAWWKLTFSHVNPAVSDRGYGSGGWCLRVYEGEKLRCVFADVTGFRDMDIPLARKVEKEVGQNSWEKDSLGNFKQTAEVSHDHQMLVEEVPF